MSEDTKVRVFISTLSGNKDIKKKQDHIKSILECKKVAFELVDIADPAMEEQKAFMREHSSKGPLPPQIFNGEEYLGDHEDFENAVEDDNLEGFLKLKP